MYAVVTQEYTSNVSFNSFSSILLHKLLAGNEGMTPIVASLKGTAGFIPTFSTYRNSKMIASSPICDSNELEPREGPLGVWRVPCSGWFKGNEQPILRPPCFSRKPSWLWLKKLVPKWNPGKWKHGPKPAQPPLFNFEPQPAVGRLDHMWLNSLIPTSILQSQVPR